MANPTVNVWIKAKDAATSVFKGVEHSLQNVKKAFSNIALPIAEVVGTIGEFLYGLTELTERGAKVIGVQQAFNKVVGGDGKEAIAELRAETHGLISDYDLMRGLNTAVALGSARTVKEFGELAHASHQLGLAFGVDAGEALEALNAGIARGTRITIGNRLITVDATEANKDYAESHGKTVAQLTALEKKEAFRIATLEEVHRITKDVGGAQIEAALAGERWAVSVGNLKDSWATWLAQSPTVHAFLDFVTSKFQQLAGLDPGIEKMRQAAAKMKTLTEVQERMAAIGARERAIPGEKARMGWVQRGQAGPGGGKALDYELEQLKAEGRVLLERKEQLLNAGKILTPDADKGGGKGPASQLVLNNDALKMLLDNLEKAQTAFRDKSLDNAIAPSEETLKALNKARDELDGIYDLLAKVGGVGAARYQTILGETVPKRFGDIDALNSDWARSITGGMGASYMTADERARMGLSRTSTLETVRGIRVPSTLAMSAQGYKSEYYAIEQKEKEAAAAKKLADVGPVVVASLGAMAAAAISGSKITAQSVTGMLGDIAASLPGVGKLEASLIGAAAGILGGLFTRHERTPVHIESVSQSAAETMANAKNARPVQVTVVLETPPGGVADTEAALRNREARDAVRRYTSSGRY